MRGLIIAALFAVVGIIATLVGERFMSNAPEWVWRLAYGTLVVGPVTIVLLHDPLFGYLKNFREHPALSTAIIAAASGIFLGAVWLFFIVGFPSSKPYLAAKQQSGGSSSESAPGSSPSPQPTPVASPKITAFTMKNVMGGAMYDNVAENVEGTTFDIQDSKNVIMRNNRVINQPPPTKQDTQSKPELVGNWLTLLTSRTLGTTKGEGIMPLGSLIAVRFAVSNTGASSIAKSFQLHVRSPSFATDLGQFGVKDELKIRDEKGNVVNVIHANETMIKKTTSPIARGQPPVIGWLLYHVPDIDYGALADKKELEVSFEDATGRQYRVKVEPEATPPSSTPDKGASPP